MSPSDEERLRSDIDYWREEALIAGEQGDEEQARTYWHRADALQRKLDTLMRSSVKQVAGRDTLRHKVRGGAKCE